MSLDDKLLLKGVTKMSSRKHQIRDWKFILGLVGGSILIVVILEHFAVPRITRYAKAHSTQEIIAVCAILIAVCGLTWQIIFYKLTHYPIINLGLKVLKEGPLLIKVVSSVENLGGGKIFPRTAHLIVDQGTESGVQYKFPELLFYKEGAKHCNIATHCHSGAELSTYPSGFNKEFKDCFCACLPLAYFSKSLSWIGKLEKFSESTYIKLPSPGLYRIILVFSTKNDKCRCRYEVYNLTNPETSVNE
jgi:hypothetical protein